MSTTTKIISRECMRTARREYSSGLFQGVRHYFFSKPKVKKEPDMDQYFHYPLVTKDQIKKITNDKFKFDFGYGSFAYHSDLTLPTINSLSDLTEPTQLTSLLPRRRPHGSPVDTLSIRAGDDAMLVSPTVLAVADGVSGWESKGENCSSGIWSRAMLETMSRLMTEYKLNHSPYHLQKRDIDQILDDSYLHTSHLMDLQNMKGSSTLALAMLSGDLLQMISIGDSKIYVIRGGKVIKQNEVQMISDLCPQQIGSHTLTHFPSEIAWVDSIKLKTDDIVVVCSDGISDNLYEWEIVHYIEEYLGKKMATVKSAANKLLLKAKEVAFDDYSYTPYNEKVNTLPEKRFGKHAITGGKLDDMSLCIAKVQLNEKSD